MELRLTAWPTSRTDSAMRIIKLAWVGTRTDNAEPTVAFFREVLGLRLELDQPGFWMLKLPDGSKVEVFGPDSDVNRHFTTGPVAGFLVDDVQEAAAELRSAGAEILFESEVDGSGNAWVHFPRPGRQRLRVHPGPWRLPTRLTPAALATGTLRLPDALAPNGLEALRNEVSAVIFASPCLGYVWSDELPSGPPASFNTRQAGSPARTWSTRGGSWGCLSRRSPASDPGPRRLGRWQRLGQS
jgi:catechol 2,3-dioxygenase-like lactoylglutathione lyase family enzyme